MTRDEFEKCLEAIRDYSYEAGECEADDDLTSCNRMQAHATDEKKIAMAEYDRLSNRVAEMEEELGDVMYGQCRFCKYQQVSINSFPCAACAYNPDSFVTDRTQDNWQPKEGKQ